MVLISLSSSQDGDDEWWMKFAVKIITPTQSVVPERSWQFLPVRRRRRCCWPLNTTPTMKLEWCFLNWKSFEIIRKRCGMKKGFEWGMTCLSSVTKAFPIWGGRLQNDLGNGFQWSHITATPSSIWGNNVDSGVTQFRFEIANFFLFKSFYAFRSRKP